MDDIREKVLQANGISQNDIQNQSRDGILHLIKREKNMFFIAKIIASIFWIVSITILGFYMYAVKLFLYNQGGEITDQFMKETLDVIMLLETILPLSIITAAVFTIFLYIRAKSINLLQVHERLHNLEEMMKVLLAK